MIPSFGKKAAALYLLISPISAADCDLSQQRQSSFPSGQQIANALTKNNALENVCSNDFSSAPYLIKIYNEGSVNYNVTRKSDDEEPGDNNCSAGFQDIIDQCIVTSSYWGGVYTYNDLTYAISNAVYPSNGLPSWDATSSGGGSATPTGTTVVPSGTPAPGPTKSSGGAPVTSVPGETVVTETNTAGSQIVATVSIGCGESNWGWLTRVVCSNHFDTIRKLEDVDDNNYHDDR